MIRFDGRPNKLIDEKSPYLLQHAYNPVYWYPWGKEAFEKAEKENKPIFLSIGYSTCHWCHVMEHESFEDKEVAAVLNRNFVCIKVDREERPDIDSVYMSVCQMFTGSGGWPMTIIMTPEQKPFWAGTYLPKTAAYGRMGLLELLDAVYNLWEDDREEVISKGDQVLDLLQKQHKTQRKSIEPSKEFLFKAAEQFKRSYDVKWGGFGSAPKFPTPHNLLFLLQYPVLEKDDLTLEMVKHTLTQMYRGGIFDHLSGGFSRYSTDSKWLIPHFEKMLYDNALLCLAYLDAYRITKDSLYRIVAERTLVYVLNELRDENGGFYCGQDADSEGVEGKFYVFTKDEIFNVLGKDDGTFFCDWFGITERGNFEGKNILNLLDNPRFAEMDPRITELSHKLYSYRLTRTKLHKDDKILTSWNALMITAFAKAGWLLKNPEYIKVAVKAHQFIQEFLSDVNGYLKLRYREGEAAHDGQLDDYAFYAYSLLELYKSTYEIGYLKKAIVVSDRMIHHFWDDKQSGFYLYSKESEQLISRPKETYDGAIPSGNSIAAIVLETLSKLTGEEKWRQISNRQLVFIATSVQDYPAGHSMALLAISQAVNDSYELVCATSEKSIPKELNLYLTENPIQNIIVLIKTNENQAELEKVAPYSKSYPIPENGSIYYLCHNGACFAPVDTLAKLNKLLS